MKNRKAPAKKEGFYSLILAPLSYPLMAVILMWAVHIGASEAGVRLSEFGVKPRTTGGLLGILTMPFIHGSYEHLLNNSLPLLVLGWALFKFYPTIAWKALLGIWFIGGIWLWISGRDAYHIGASGVVYGLAAFLFLSGWLRREKRVAALSLAIVFIYGGMWWGILPVKPTVSWEGHLWGAIAGFAMAVYLRKQGPQRQLYQWEIDEIEEQKKQALMETLTFEWVQPLDANEQDISADTAQKTAPEDEIHPSGAAKNYSVNYEYRPGKKPGSDK